MFRLVKSQSTGLNTIEISQAKFNDIKDLAKFAKSAYEESFPGYYTKEQLEILFSHSAYVKHFSNTKHFYFFAKIQGEIIGYAKLIYENEPNVFLDKLYISKKFQNLGLGKKLIQTCFNHAISKNYNTMHLEVWDKNENSIRFYEKCGFIIKTSFPYVYPDGLKSNDVELVMACDDIRAHLQKIETSNERHVIA